MAERPKFQEKQYAFAAHIRDPQNVPAPEGIEDRRMAIYRELFFNNLKSLLSNMFPVLTKLHSDQHWRRLVRTVSELGLRPVVDRVLDLEHGRQAFEALQAAEQFGKIVLAVR